MIESAVGNLAPISDAKIGCPSGLEPLVVSSLTEGADPSAFVKAQGGNGFSLELLVRGAKCGGCLARIEGKVRALPDVEDVRLNLTTGRLTVGWRGRALNPHAITQAVAGLGYGVAPFDADLKRSDDKKEARELLKCLAVAAFAAANVMLLSVSVWAGHGEMSQATRDLFHWLSGLIALPAAAYAGRPFFKSALNALRVGQVNMDVPISLGVTLACAMSIYETMKSGDHAFFDAAVMLLFFLLIGRYLDVTLRAKARAAAGDLMALRATAVTRMDADNIARSVPVREIVAGDRILLASGERAGVDLEIFRGQTLIDASLVTGESAPVEVALGGRIYSGSINLGPSVEARAIASADDSLLADIARLMEAGEQGRSTYRVLAERAARLYVPVVHTLAASCFLAWLFVFKGGFEVAAYNAIALLIITCPCALALAAPVVQIVAVGRMFKRHVLVKSGDALQRLAECDVVAMDKTGTLTLGRPVLVLAPEDKQTLAQAAMLARASRHPLSRALVNAVGAGPLAQDVVEEAGQGLQAVLEGVSVKLGSARFVGLDPKLREAQGLTHAEMWFKWGDEPPLRFLFEDQLRPDARAVIAGLHARGLEVELISGDRLPAVAAAANAAGITQFTAGMTPRQKTERIEALKAKGRRPLVLGDGLNDAAALTSGHASISPGSAADLSQNAADLVLQGDSLLPLLAAIDGSRAAKRRMLENFAFAALYNVVAVPIAFAGWVTPLVAALAMSGSSILVTLNALRTDPPFRAHKRRKDTATPQGQANHAGPAVVAR